jgi:hypothetical protein
VIFRNSRTPSEYISYGLYFYFSGLSLRKAAADSVDYQQIALSKETIFLLELDSKLILNGYPL